MSKGFSKSIGGDVGSRGIRMNSVALSQASGNAIGGYASPKSGAAADTHPEHGAARSEPSRPKMSTRSEESNREGGGKLGPRGKWG